MKNILKRVMRDEKGAAMVLAVILLLVGGLIVSSLLSYMGTGLLISPVYEGRVAELYAADAGVEDAVWRIQQPVPEVENLYKCDDSWSYNITDGEGEVAELNGKRVEVTITLVDNLTSTYRVVSIATGAGSGTQVEAYITGTIVYDDYSGILDNILTSQGELEWKTKVDLIYPEENEPAANYAGSWPPVWLLEDFYAENVTGAPHYYENTLIDLGGVNNELGPLYVDGKLDIVNSSNDEATLILNGTLYITGDTTIGKTGKDFILDLNGHTIFVESSSADPDKALWIGANCNIEGPGVIIAVGDIYFGPKGYAGSEGAPVFVFSVTGTSTIQPSIDIHGAVAGSVEVSIQPGNDPTITYPEGGFGGYNLNFPGFVAVRLAYGIASWEVSQL